MEKLLQQLGELAKRIEEEKNNIATKTTFVKYLSEKREKIEEEIKQLMKAGNINKADYGQVQVKLTARQPHVEIRDQDALVAMLEKDHKEFAQQCIVTRKTILKSALLDLWKSESRILNEKLYAIVTPDDKSLSFKILSEKTTGEK